jgi:Domain of unknown function (DUF1772)
MEVAGVVAVVLTGLAAGLLTTLSWIYRQFPSPLLAPTLRETVRIIGPVFGAHEGRRAPAGQLPPLIFAGIVASAVFAGFAWGNGVAFGFALTAALTLVAGVLVTGVFLIPLHSEMVRWPEERPPAGYERVVRRWLVVNDVRALLALASLAAAAVALAAAD